MRILISGGAGRLPSEINKQNTEHEIILVPKSEMEVSEYQSVFVAIEKYRPDVFIHSGALTKPMNIHIEKPILSIDSNIIGTCNVVKACIKKNIKLVYISTDYVYPGTNGNFKETDDLNPVNEYGWSKLGGECAVKLYDNSLILRVSKIQNPFPHEKAIDDIYRSTVFDDEAARLVLSLLNEKGVINLGGERLSVYDFAKNTKPNIERISRKDITDVNMAVDSSMDITKMKNITNGRD